MNATFKPLAVLIGGAQGRTVLSWHSGQTTKRTDNGSLQRERLLVQAMRGAKEGGHVWKGGIKRCVINAWETRGVTLEWLTFVMLVGRSADKIKHLKLASGVAGTYPGPQMAMVGRGGTGGVEYQWDVVKNKREEKEESL